MPEPNLPPLRLLELGINPHEFLSRIPILPDQERKSLMDQYALNLETVAQLTASRLLVLFVYFIVVMIFFFFKQNGGNLKFFKAVMAANPELQVKRVTSLLLTELTGLLNKNDKTIQQW